MIDPRTGLCADGAIVAAGSLAPSGEPTKLPHCILEFTAGTSHGDLTLPRSSRIILRFGDEPIECDEQFLAMTPVLATAAGAGLVSGLNGRGWRRFKRRYGRTRLAPRPGPCVVRRGSRGHPPRARRVHHATGAARGRHHEPGHVAGPEPAERFTLTGSRGDPRLLARDVAALSGARRVIVHADDWALAVHRGTPHQEDVRHTERRPGWPAACSPPPGPAPGSSCRQPRPGPRRQLHRRPSGRRRPGGRLAGHRPACPRRTCACSDRHGRTRGHVRGRPGARREPAARRPLTEDQRPTIYLGPTPHDRPDAPVRTPTA